LWQFTFRQATATGLRLDISFSLTDAVSLNESAILLTTEIQDCDCAVYDCSLNAMDHAFGWQVTTISSPFSNQPLSLYVQSCFSNSKQYIELLNVCDESRKSTQWLNKMSADENVPHILNCGSVIISPGISHGNAMILEKHKRHCQKLRMR
jgi:hypothetical protein